MKKNKKSRAISRIAAAGAFLACQVNPESLSAQKTLVPADSVKLSPVQQRQNFFLKFANTKLADQKLTVAALLNGEPVLKMGGKELYQVNTQTGDIRLVTTDEYNKLTFNDKVCCALKGTIGGAKAGERQFKTEGIKMSFKIKEGEFYTKNQILFLGVDKDGHDIFQNSKKEKFFFDPATGDMIDFNGHVATFK
jgi:hypothetical protein